ncbi:hypothetical protein IFR05_013400 [Cadophora sp. M221]|nr:hypothetical protein IFR05_013400 [Cadophora sp. M221]
MPKNWVAQKENLKQFYITEDRPLEEVREILKDRYGFDASIRSYRMKIDEWNLRKYKSKKAVNNRGTSAQARPKSNRRTSDCADSSIPPTVQTESIRVSNSVDNGQRSCNPDDDHVVNNFLPRNDDPSKIPRNGVTDTVENPWDHLFRTSTPLIYQNLPQVLTSLAKHNTGQKSFAKLSSLDAHNTLSPNLTEPYHLWQFNAMLKNWRDDKGIKKYANTVLSIPGSKVTTFRTMETGMVNLFDFVCKSVEKSEQLPLIKDFLRIFSESNPQEPSPQYICWRSAFIESDWTKFKRALGLVNLNGCMSRETARLVFRATFLLVGERLIDGYRARFDMGESLGSAVTDSTFKHFQRYLESPAYFRDREQYDSMLKDFRLRCVNHWE